MILPRLGEGPVSKWLAARQRPRWPDLRAFLDDLERREELLRVPMAVDSKLEITALCRHSLIQNGPALLFENVRGENMRRHSMPVLGNLYGSRQRIARALGLGDPSELREFGHLLSFFQSPELPAGLPHALADAPKWARLAHVKPRILEQAPARELVLEGGDVDLEKLPIQLCWPEDAGPLLSFGLVITRGVHKARLNAAIYRQQLIGRNRLIMRWLAHRGGAQDYREWQARHPERPFPVAVAIGADPATTLAAVAPIPDTLSEFDFAGLMRGARTELIRCARSDLLAPARAEIILEGHIRPGDMAEEGPFCDHTGYYNAVDQFPVFTVERISMRDQAIYQTSYMGRPPDDEPSVLAGALNEMFVPLLQRQFPEIADFYLPPAACSYRIALVSIRKQYPGHARRIMFGIWSWLRQFTYTKYVIVVDDDIDIRDVDQVLWAVSTRSDPAGDSVVIDSTPIDYLDFASPASGLGGKLGLDATTKWRAESKRDWGRVAAMPDAVQQRVEDIWRALQPRYRTRSTRSTLRAD